MTSTIRSLSRQIWISVALPPTTEQPSHAKGKTPVTSLDASHLHHRKVEALRLCLSFAFASKHYLRGEDGIHWDDFQGVLPAAFVHFGKHGFNTQQTTGSRSHSAMSDDSNKSSDGERGSGTSTPDGPKQDATKRVRAKRSKPQIVTSTTPLLSGSHYTVDFSAPPVDTASMPLPMMLVWRYDWSILSDPFVSLESVMSCHGSSTASGKMVVWKQSVQLVSLRNPSFSPPFNPIRPRCKCNVPIV